MQNSGDLHIGFLFTASNRTGNWDLEAVAMLADSNFNPINSTLSVSAFTIQVYDVANVYVNVPEPVNLKLDGTLEGPGSFQVSLRLGSNHTFSVPLVEMINETSRLELLWFGGYGASDVAPPFAHNDSGYVRVSMHVLQDTNLTAYYVEEYWVSMLNTGYNVTTTQTSQPKPMSGWYRQGTLAYLGTVSSPQPLDGFLGELGAREVFDGWYVNGRYINNTSYVAVPVSGPLTVEARWHVEYTTPITIAAGIVLAICALIGYATFTKRRPNAQGRDG
jgi:hypothetical protein